MGQFWPDSIAAGQALPDSVGDVLADLVGVHVERSDDLDIAHGVGAELGVHQAGNVLVSGGFGVEMDALDQAGGAVAQPDDGNVAGIFTHESQHKGDRRGDLH